MERRRAVRIEVLAPVLEIALDAHRTEEEPAEDEPRRLARQAVAHDAHASGIGDEGDVAREGECRRGAGRVARAEADALVRRVCPQIDDASLVPPEIDLQRVPFRVAIEAGAIA